MNNRVVVSCALVMTLAGAGLSQAGVGVSPPGKIYMVASLADAEMMVKQDIIGPEKANRIIGPDVFTSLTHLQVCHPPDPGMPGSCVPENVKIKVTAADSNTARAGGLLVAVGELAGIIGPDVERLLNKYFGQTLQVSVTGSGSVVGIIGPEQALDVMLASLSATVPRGLCTFSGPPQPCLQDLPGLLRDGAATLGVGGVCAP